MSQADFIGTVTQSHISLLEAGETSVSTDTLDAMCSSLGMHPVAFMALVYSAYEQLTPAQVLERAQANITEFGLAEQRFGSTPEDHPHPRVSSAAKARRAVHELKKSGHSQAEISGLLQMAESTVRRHWHRKDD